MLKVNMKKILDLSKIQHLTDQAAVKILVGFPGGRQHVPTLHKTEDGKGYKDDFGDPANPKPIDTADLARDLSLGTATIPARPFLKEGIESQKDKLKTIYKTELSKIQQGQKANWDKVGVYAVGAIQEFVRSDYYKENVPNSKKTIEYKGSDMPLIDGGDLIGAVTYNINDGESFVTVDNKGTAHSQTIEEYRSGT